MVSVAEDGHMYRHRGHGLVQEVFNEAQLQKLEGKMCLGHVLYTTANGLFAVRCGILSRMHAVWFRAEYRPSPYPRTSAAPAQSRRPQRPRPLG